MTEWQITVPVQHRWLNISSFKSWALLCFTGHKEKAQNKRKATCFGQNRLETAKKKIKQMAERDFIFLYEHIMVVFAIDSGHQQSLWVYFSFAMKQREKKSSACRQDCWLLYSFSERCEKSIRNFPSNLLPGGLLVANSKKIIMVLIILSCKLSQNYCLKCQLHHSKLDEYDYFLVCEMLKKRGYFFPKEWIHVRTQLKMKLLLPNPWLGEVLRFLSVEYEMGLWPQKFEKHWFRGKIKMNYLFSKRL